jgi:membrane associated rhomboid family serine protease
MVFIGLNVAMFLYGVVRPGGSVDQTANAVQFGLFGPAVANGEWYRLVTNGFVHSGLLHISMNMLVIWLVGAQLEPAMGRIRFSLLYMASLLAGSAGALVVSPHALTVGASGAAFGLMGALAIGMWHRGISIWRTGIGTLIILNLAITVAVPGISLGGHVGGLIGGLAAGWVLLRVRKPGHAFTASDLAAPVGVMAVALAVAYLVVS